MTTMTGSLGRCGERQFRCLPCVRCSFNPLTMTWSNAASMSFIVPASPTRADHKETTGFSATRRSAPGCGLVVSVDGGTQSMRPRKGVERPMSDPVRGRSIRFERPVSRRRKADETARRDGRGRSLATVQGT